MSVIGKVINVEFQGKVYEFPVHYGDSCIGGFELPDDDLLPEFNLLVEQALTEHFGRKIELLNEWINFNESGYFLNVITRITVVERMKFELEHIVNSKSGLRSYFGNWIKSLLNK